MKFKKILIPLIIVMMVFMMALPSLAEPVTYPDGGVYCNNLYDFFTFAGSNGIVSFSSNGEFDVEQYPEFITKTDTGVIFDDGAVLSSEFYYYFTLPDSYESVQLDFSVTFYALVHNEDNVSGMFNGYITIDNGDGQIHEPTFYIYPTVVDGIPYYTVNIHEEYVPDSGSEFFLSDSWLQLEGVDTDGTELEFVQVGDMEFYFGPIRPDEPTVFENVISNTTGFIAGAVSWVKLFAQTIVAYPLLFVFVVAIPLVGLGIGLVTRVKR